MSDALGFGETTQSAGLYPEPEFPLGFRPKLEGSLCRKRVWQTLAIEWQTLATLWQNLATLWQTFAIRPPGLRLAIRVIRVI